MLPVWCVGMIERGSKIESHKIFWTRNDAYLFAVAMSYDSGIEQIALWEMTKLDKEGKGAPRCNTA